MEIVCYPDGWNHTTTPYHPACLDWDGVTDDNTISKYEPDWRGNPLSGRQL
jgi:hypothetical protein